MMINKWLCLFDKSFWTRNTIDNIHGLTKWQPANCQMDQMWRHRRAASRAEPMARELASNEPMAFGVILQASLSLNLNQTNNFFAVSILIRFSSKYFSTHFVFFRNRKISNEN